MQSSRKYSNEFDSTSISHISSDIPCIHLTFFIPLQGGKDFASPRYIYTQLTPMARALYPEADDALLNYLEVNNNDSQWHTIFHESLSIDKN